MKPVMYVANVDEKGFKNNPLLTPNGGICGKRRRAGRGDLRRARVGNRGTVGRGETRVLGRYRYNEPGLNRFIRAAYQLLGLQTYFTPD